MCQLNQLKGKLSVQWPVRWSAIHFIGRQLPESCAAHENSRSSARNVINIIKNWTKRHVSAVIRSPTARKLLRVLQLVSRWYVCTLHCVSSSPNGEGNGWWHNMNRTLVTKNVIKKGKNTRCVGITTANNTNVTIRTPSIYVLHVTINQIDQNHNSAMTCHQRIRGAQRQRLGWVLSK